LSEGKHDSLTKDHKHAQLFLWMASNSAPQSEWQSPLWPNFVQVEKRCIKWRNEEHEKQKSSWNRKRSYTAFGGKGNVLVFVFVKKGTTSPNIFDHAEKTVNSSRKQSHFSCFSSELVPIFTPKTHWTFAILNSGLVAHIAWILFRERTSKKSVTKEIPLAARGRSCVFLPRKNTILHSAMQVVSFCCRFTPFSNSCNYKPEKNL